MRRIQPHLGLATAMRISNVWLIDAGPCGRVLVDTGHPLERPALLWSLWRAGVRRRGDLGAVVLTHRHSDHAGNAAWLRRRFGCPVVCHEHDAEILSGRRPPERLARGKGSLVDEVLCRVEDRFPARCEVDETFADGRWRERFRAIPIPGHTEGSSLLLHEPTGTLFTGDGVLSGPPPLRAIEWLSLAKPAYSIDVDACRARVREVMRTLPPIRALCSGHGPPVTRMADAKLRRVARRPGG